MKCNICDKPSKVEGVCYKCQFRISGHLMALPDLQATASDYLRPGRSGNGSVSAERSIGINVSALDFSMATELLAILHGWEILIREGRKLTPPALVKRLATTELEVRATCQFHLSHLDWTLKQDWAKDFIVEVGELHAKGIAACKQFVEQPRKIPCPSDDCKRSVVIDAQRLSEYGLTEEITCFGCKQSWSIIRLITLAMNNPEKKFFLDAEAIASLLGLKIRQVYNIIKFADVERQGSLYNVKQVIEAR